MFKGILQAFGAGRSGSLQTERIKINGITCRNCVRTIIKALLTKSGVTKVYIDRKTGVASVTYDPAKTDPQMLREIILRKGYFPEEAAA